MYTLCHFDKHVIYVKFLESDEIIVTTFNWRVAQGAEKKAVKHQMWMWLVQLGKIERYGLR